MISVALLIGSLLAGCAEPAPLLPSTVELTTDSSAPLTEISFLATPPIGTASNAKISLVTLDTIAGLDLQRFQHPMTRRNDGRYEVKLTVPVGSLVTYRYLRTSPSEAVEVTTSFEPVSYRVAHVPGPAQIEETIAGWADLPSENPGGRIIGRILDATTGRGVPELLVSAGGRTVFSEFDGVFRIDGLTEGIHQLTVFSPAGAFLPSTQGALVASGTTIPAQLEVRPAKQIFVTFQLTLPEGLSPDAVVRLAGNLSTLGNRFSDLAGGMRVSVQQMPMMVRIDPQHFLAVLSLYAGTDLRYKYTLGDGIWNAERDIEGVLLTRQVILPEQDVVLRDSLSAWGDPGTSPLRFLVNVPDETPEGEQVAIQFKPSVWYPPLPMWRMAGDTWYYDLYGPLGEDTEIQYRFCRNAQCGSADDADTAGLDASGRLLSYSGNAPIIEDQVHAWRWLEQTPASPPIVAKPVQARPDVITGLELAANYQPSWRPLLNERLHEMRALGSDTLVFPVTWVWFQQNPSPLLGLDPSQSPMRDELGEFTRHARDTGIDVIFKINPMANGQSASTWWDTADRDRDWWQLWFEQYRSFALTTAELGAALGTEALILGGEWTWPALPEGLLPAGEPSGVPGDALDRWRSLITEIRTIYPGRITFELPMSTELPSMPDFLDSVDAILFSWQVPISGGFESDAEQMAQGFIPFLDLLDSRTERFNRPLWISIEYASVQGGAASCPPAPDGSCRSIALFERGQDVDPDINPSFEEQTRAINAVFLAAYDRPSIQAFFIMGFDPSALMWDKSSSIYGKPAEDVLRYWYPRINGE